MPFTLSLREGDLVSCDRERVRAFDPALDLDVVDEALPVGGLDVITIPMDKFEKGGDYTFFCSFPGHWSVMKGKLIFG